MPLFMRFINIGSIGPFISEHIDARKCTLETLNTRNGCKYERLNVKDEKMSDCFEKNSC